MKLGLPHPFPAFLDFTMKPYLSKLARTVLLTAGLISIPFGLT